MFKLSGAVLIISASCVWGFSKSVRLKKRAENLIRMVASLVMLENEISFGGKNIKEALSAIAKAEKLPFFAEVSERIGELSVSEAFSEAISKADMQLSGTDNAAILEFSRNLGGLDTASQIKSIAHTRKVLETAQAEAAEDYRRYGNMYRSMGFLGGILFALILF